MGDLLCLNRHTSGSKGTGDKGKERKAQQHYNYDLDSQSTHSVRERVEWVSEWVSGWLVWLQNTSCERPDKRWRIWEEKVVIIICYNSFLFVNRYVQKLPLRNLYYHQYVDRIYNHLSPLLWDQIPNYEVIYFITDSWGFYSSDLSWTMHATMRLLRQKNRFQCNMAEILSGMNALFVDFPKVGTAPTTGDQLVVSTLLSALLLKPSSIISTSAAFPQENAPSK